MRSKKHASGCMVGIKLFNWITAIESHQNAFTSIYRLTSSGFISPFKRIFFTKWEQYTHNYTHYDQSIGRQKSWNIHSDLKLIEEDDQIAEEHQIG